MCQGSNILILFPSSFSVVSGGAQFSRFLTISVSAKHVAY